MSTKRQTDTEIADGAKGQDRASTFARVKQMFEVGKLKHGKTNGNYFGTIVAQIRKEVFTRYVLDNAQKIEHVYPKVKETVTGRYLNEQTYAKATNLPLETLEQRVLIPAELAAAYLFFDVYNFHRDKTMDSFVTKQQTTRQIAEDKVITIGQILAHLFTDDLLTSIQNIVAKYDSNPQIKEDARAAIKCFTGVSREEAIEIVIISSNENGRGVLDYRSNQYNEPQDLVPVWPIVSSNESASALYALDIMETEGEHKLKQVGIPAAQKWHYDPLELNIFYSISFMDGMGSPHGTRLGMSTLLEGGGRRSPMNGSLEQLSISEENTMNDPKNMFALPTEYAFIIDLNGERSSTKWQNFNPVGGSYYHRAPRASELKMGDERLLYTVSENRFASLMYGETQFKWNNK